MSGRSLVRRPADLRRRCLRLECFEARRLLAADLWGIVWNDANDDGQRQESEARQAEWRIFLDHNANGNWDDGERSALTNAQGRYHLGDVAAGEYVVALAVRDGWTATAPDAGIHVVHVESGDVNDDLHFGVRQLGDAGQIAGIVWNDLDGDGQREDGEPPLADWPVFLDHGDVWIQENVEIWPPPAIHVAFTNADGRYRFEEVRSGDHTVTVDLGDGWTATSPESGSHQVTVQAGQVLDGLNFGLDAPEFGQIAGVVWNDLDGDGQREEGEPPLADLPVYLDDFPVGILEASDGVAWPVFAVLTDDSGAFRFDEVRIGDHIVTVGLNEGWAPTQPVNGAYEVSVVADEVIEGLDFGLLAPEVGQITGSLWNDLDGDGQREDGEPPLANWPVYLDGSLYDDPGMLDPNAPLIFFAHMAYTNDDGAYQFGNVIVGDHIVTPVREYGWTVTAPESGFHEFQLEADQVLEGLDFGLKAPEVGHITGSVWNDLDGDGQRDEGEPPLTDWPVYLEGYFWHDPGEPDPNTPSFLPGHVVYTNEEGVYRFEEVIVGDHVVKPGPGDGWTVTSPDLGFHEVHQRAVAGDHVVTVDPVDGWKITAPADGLYHVTLGAGETIDGLDFGLFATAHLNTSQDVPVECLVLGNDRLGPIDVWDPEMLTIVEPPQHGTVHIGWGTITYVPQPGYFGPDAFVYEVANEESPVSTTAVIEIQVGLREHPWQNPRMRWDVDDSGQVSITDALAEVTELREGGARLLPPNANLAGEAEAPGAAPATHRFYDVNGDNMISVGDLLDVIFHIRDGATSAAAEGEADDSSPPSAEFVPTALAADDELIDAVDLSTGIASAAFEEEGDPIGCATAISAASPSAGDNRVESLEAVLETIAEDVLLAA